MLKSIRRSVFHTIIATMPLLLTACGEGTNDGPPKKAMLILAALFMTVSLAHQQLKLRTNPNR